MRKNWDSPGGKVLPLPRFWHVLEEVEEDEGEAGHLEDVGDHGEWGQVLEVADRAEHQHGDEDNGHVHVVVNLLEVVVTNLGNKNMSDLKRS